jgi:hypothetical protein
MVLKYLVPLLAISSVYAGRFIGNQDARCDWCVSTVNKTETSVVTRVCSSFPNAERQMCRDVVSLALPKEVCRDLGYCPIKK